MPNLKDIKAGDTMIITNRTSKDVMAIYHVDRVRGIGGYPAGPGQARLAVNGSRYGAVYVSKDDFEFIEPVGTKIQVGDHVVLTQSAYPEFVGTRYTVATVDDKVGNIICCDDNGQDFSFAIDRCVILKHYSMRSLMDSKGVCKDCGGTGEIQLFTSVVDCECQGG